MDKGRDNINVQAMVLMVLLLFAGQASASFKKCFTGCAIGCIIGTENKFVCVLKCFGKCLIGVVSPPDLAYCKLGCAVDQCSHFAYDFKIEDVDDVDRCVNECETGQCGFLLAAQAMASQTSDASQTLSPTEAP